MYIHRHAEKSIATLSKMFSSVLVTGPRQVGKITLLKRLLPNGFYYVTMDDGVLRMSAKTNPITFLKDNPPPVFIDEVQKAPELLEQIKIYADSTHLKGQFYLSGSQQIRIMKGVSESLSGRIGILKMLGLSLREEAEITFDEPFVPIESFFCKKSSFAKNSFI